MLAIEHPGLFHQRDLAESAGHQGQPPVVHQRFSRDRQGFLQQGPVEQRRATGHHIGERQIHGISAMRVQALALQVARTQRLSLAIHQLQIAVHQKGGIRSVERLQLLHQRQGLLELLGQPEIVLIRQGHIRSVGGLQQAIHIGGAAEVAVRREHLQPGAVTLLEVGDQGCGAIARAVVAQDHPVGLQGLRMDRGQLGLQVGGAVVGGEHHLDRRGLRMKRLRAANRFIR